MPSYAFAALAIISVTSVVVWVLGRRFTLRFRAKTGAIPPWNWMFRRTDDPELEGPRRLALALLPIYLVALVLYLFRP
jgi:hypothetical protein